MTIICDDKIPFLRGVLEPFAEVVYMPGKQTSPELVRDADAIITRTRTICNQSLLEGSKVRAIATATIGFDHIDTKWCESNGIQWSNAPGCNSWSVKQYVSSVICALAQKHNLKFEDLTLGVVGVGNVGSKVAEVAAVMGLKVLLNDPPRARKEGKEGFVELSEIVEKSDIITLHVPLEKQGDDATYHLFDAQMLAKLSSRQFLINSSRGPVVDNAALKDALKAGKLRGAVLDVWEGEPELDRELLGLLDIATPHIAGYSADGKANGTTASVRMIAKVLGLPLVDWTASGVPEPKQALNFCIDAKDKSAQEIMSEAIWHCYDVRCDDADLRANPSAFESLRGDYAVRREPTAFSLRVLNSNPLIEEKLRQIGFTIVA